MIYKSENEKYICPCNLQSLHSAKAYYVRKFSRKHRNNIKEVHKKIRTCSLYVDETIRQFCKQLASIITNSSHTKHLFKCSTKIIISEITQRCKACLFHCLCITWYKYYFAQPITM